MKQNPDRGRERRFVPIVAGCHFEVARFAIQPERRGVSGRHQITPDKGTTNWYHPNERRSPRKIRAAIAPRVDNASCARGERDTECVLRANRCGVSLAFLDVTSDF